MLVFKVEIDINIIYVKNLLNLLRNYISSTIIKLIKDKNNIRNLFPACADCNLLKGSLDISEFREKIEDLIYDNSRGRTIAKYYEIEPREILFYFEKRKEK